MASENVTFPSTYQPKDVLLSIPSQSIIKETQETTFYIKTKQNAYIPRVQDTNQRMRN